MSSLYLTLEHPPIVTIKSEHLDDVNLNVICLSLSLIKLSKSTVPLCKKSHLNFQQLLPSINPVPVIGSISAFAIHSSYHLA